MFLLSYPCYLFPCRQQTKKKKLINSFILDSSEIFYKIISYQPPICILPLSIHPSINIIFASMKKNTKVEWMSRDNLSSLLFALVTYRHVKHWFTHLLDRSQTLCLDSKFILIFKNQKFQFMTFTLANDHFIV